MPASRKTWKFSVMLVGCSGSSWKCRRSFRTRPPHSTCCLSGFFDTVLETAGKSGTFRHFRLLHSVEWSWWHQVFNNNNNKLTRDVKQSSDFQSSFLKFKFDLHTFGIRFWRRQDKAGEAGSTINNTLMMLSLFSFAAALYEHRSTIKHAINKTKMRPASKIEHYHITAMLCKTP